MLLLAWSNPSRSCPTALLTHTACFLLRHLQPHSNLSFPEPLEGKTGYRGLLVHSSQVHDELDRQILATKGRIVVIGCGKVRCPRPPAAGRRSTLTLYTLVLPERNRSRDAVRRRGPRRHHHVRPAQVLQPADGRVQGRLPDQEPVSRALSSRAWKGTGADLDTPAALRIISTMFPAQTLVSVLECVRDRLAASRNSSVIADRAISSQLRRPPHAARSLVPQALHGEGRQGPGASARSTGRPAILR